MAFVDDIVTNINKFYIFINVQGLMAENATFVDLIFS